MLTLICGLSRAGKTTYSTIFKCKVLHLDDYGQLKNAYERINAKVGTDEDIVVEGIYNKAEQRMALIRAYRGVGAKCIWLDTPIRIKQTRKGYCSACEYPFEPPTIDEGWDELEILGENYGVFN